MLLVSETAKTLINEDNARRGTIKVFEAIQNVQLNKHMFYVSCNVVVLKCIEGSKNSVLNVRDICSTAVTL